MSFLNRFRNFDVYTKPVDDCRVKTSFGGLITLISLTVIVLLFVSETVSYFSIEVVEQLFVDSTSAEQRVDIHFDITFHKLPCDFISVDVMGLSGESQDAIEHDISKQRLDEDGVEIDGTKPEKQAVNMANSTAANGSLVKAECGSCYGAGRGCCNTCQDVKDAYRLHGWQIEDLSTIEQCREDVWLNKLRETKGQGCRIYGRVDVGGNFHIAPGASSTHQHSHFHDFHSLSPANFDTSHTFNHLSFGKPFPGKVYPLDGKQFLGQKTGIMHSYYLKVVPTQYVYGVSRGKDAVELSHQFSVTRTEKDIMAGASGIPGIFVQYEFSPLMVQYEERKRPLSYFLVNLCAIIGGVFTVASLVDSFIYNSSRAFQRKLATGKFS